MKLSVMNEGLIIQGPPPEFFTCEHRDNGLYADIKRECRFYWECGDIRGEGIDHVQKVIIRHALEEFKCTAMTETG